MDAGVGVPQIVQCESNVSNTKRDILDFESIDKYLITLMNHSNSK